MPQWWNGRHEGLKIPWPVTAVWVQVPLEVHNTHLAQLVRALTGISPLSYTQ